MRKLKLSVMALFLMGAISACNETSQTEENMETEAMGMENDSAEAMTMKVEEGNYMVVAGESEVEWVGKKVTGQHNGTIMIDSGNIMVGPTGLAGGMVRFDMTTIKNIDIEGDEDKAKLVGHLSSQDFFDVQQFPKATFTVKKANMTAEGMYDVTGDLTMKGKTNEVTFPINVDADGDMVMLKGDMTFDRTKYDVKYNSGKFFEGLGDKVINDDVTIKFDVTAKKM